MAPVYMYVQGRPLHPDAYRLSNTSLNHLCSTANILTPSLSTGCSELSIQVYMLRHFSDGGAGSSRFQKRCFKQSFCFAYIGNMEYDILVKLIIPFDLTSK